jgi:hypothetical protein
VAEFCAPLGVSVIGVVTSTLPTLIAIPTIYTILDAVLSRMTGLARRVFRPQAIENVIQAVTGEHRAGP